MTPGPSSQLRSRFVLAGILSLLAWVSLDVLAPGQTVVRTDAMQRAAGRMGEALEAVATHCDHSGIRVDRGRDPNGTCLIGPEHTQLFTSLGRLEAKRTSTNPALAVLLVHLLEEAGVGQGESVAVGASGSFPALLVATLVAIEALEAHPVAILSLGASSYGATRPDFHLLDLHRLLWEAEIVNIPPAAVSLGGSGDVGEEFEELFRERLIREMEAGDTPFLELQNLEANVNRRMEIYLGAAATGGGRIAAFVNIGGAEANLGTDARVLSVPPGLSLDLAAELSPPPHPRRGVLFEMAARGVPVVHLLNLRGLALRYGLPWDPLPLPSAASGQLRDNTRGKGWGFWALTVAYAAALAMVVFVGRGPRPDDRPVRQPA